MYEIRDLQKPIMNCSKAVFLGERFMYPVYPGFESSAAETVEASNKHMQRVIAMGKAASHV